MDGGRPMRGGLLLLVLSSIVLFSFLLLIYKIIVSLWNFKEMVWSSVFFVGVLFFLVFHFHYLFLFIGLEFLMLSLLFGLSFSGVYGSFRGLLSFLVVLVSMGGFGLSLLVFFIRGIGLDLFLFF
jgi:hypothetical protein